MHLNGANVCAWSGWNRYPKSFTFGLGRDGGFNNELIDNMLYISYTNMNDNNRIDTDRIESQCHQMLVR